MCSSPHNDAEMRAAGQRMLEGVDLETVRSIDVDEAIRIASDVKGGTPISREDVMSFALWAAKGGLKPL